MKKKVVNFRIPFQAELAKLISLEGIYQRLFLRLLLRCLTANISAKRDILSHDDGVFPKSSRTFIVFSGIGVSHKSLKHELGSV